MNAPRMVAGLLVTDMPDPFAVRHKAAIKSVRRDLKEIAQHIKLLLAKFSDKV